MEQSVWLTVASTMPIAYEGEKFYYDSKDMEFFIVGAFDYLLHESRSGFEFQYTDEVKQKLTGKLKRIKSLDPTITEIPRITFLHRLRFQRGFVFYIKDNELKERLTNLLEVRSPHEQLMLDQYIKSETVPPELLRRWNEAKVGLSRSLANTFEREHNVSLKDITVWKIDQTRSVRKVDDTTSDGDTIKGTPWWKIW